MKVTCLNCGTTMELIALEHDKVSPDRFHTTCEKCGASFDIEFNQSDTFITDIAKMSDFKDLSKEDFLSLYSYLTENEYEATELYLNWLKE